jgi:hypothetical protein
MDTGKNSKEALAIDHIDDRLLEARLCSACAGNAALKYVRGGSHKFKALVDEAMNGDQPTIERFNNGEFLK